MKGYTHPPLRGTLSRSRERAAPGSRSPFVARTRSRSRERAGVRAARIGTQGES